MACGVVALVEAPTGTLTLGLKRRPIDEAAPHCPCGARSWVLVGSTTEYYRYSRREDVCRIGDHVDSRARTFRLYPRHAADAPGVQIVSLDVNVCPDHVAELRMHGILGCFPVPNA